MSGLRGAALLAIAGSLALASPAAATTIFPDTFSDTDEPGVCTLRSAVIAANTDSPVKACPAGSGTDEIVLEDGEYRLTGFAADDNAAAGDLDILSDLRITGSQKGKSTVDAQNYDRAFHLIGPIDVTFDRLEIKQGFPSDNTGYGGNIKIDLGASLLLRDSVVRRGYASDGAGVWIGTDSSATIRRTTISDNDAADDDGGGIAVDEPGASLLLDSSTLDGNTADDDGGGVQVEDESTATIVNSTITNNFAFDDGGGVRANDPGTVAVLRNSTVSDNTAVAGGGVLQDTGTTLRARGTIIADNTGLDGPPDCADMTSAGYNLVGDTDDCTITNVASTDLLDVPAGLMPLRDNGGPTETQALDPGSPAVGAGPPDAPADDQRGAPREAPEIGAYELLYCAGVLVNRVGTDGRDKLTGTAQADGILGLAGNDRIDSAEGDDGICAGDGNDRVTAGSGEDQAFGEAGDDRLEGSAGSDAVHGGDGDDRVIGGSGADQLTGDAGDDRLDGTGGDDELLGEDGDDALNGDGGDDALQGADGDDTLRGEAGQDLLRGNDGRDKLNGGDGADAVVGGKDSDRIKGGDGADRARGGSAADLIRGGAGGDRLSGGKENDLIFGGNGRDKLAGGAGKRDYCNGGSGYDSGSKSCERQFNIPTVLPRARR